MINAKISKILIKDLLSGNSKYVKNGMLTFDQIRFDTSQENPGVKIFCEKNLLASIYICTSGHFVLGSTLTFHLTEGTMKINLSN